jgi:hypothetical protein
MPKTDNLFEARKPLGEICTVPDKIISVYSLEKHVWADSNSGQARAKRTPELKTIEEFQIDPVRPFLNDVFRNMAAPYNPERRGDNSIGQGYWIQAEFGSGKSHLLCFLSALSLGRKDAWDIVDQKEKKAERGKRESLYRFWEEGLEAKSGKGKKGIFVIVKTLVGSGSGTIGLQDKGRRLTEYILDAAKEQLELETGKNLSLYPVELLADRFIQEDLGRYRTDLKKFLRDPRYFEEDEFEDVDNFIRDIQQNKSPEYKRSCGNKLWRFYTEYLKVQPQIAAETEDVLKHLVETILAEGYSGVLLVLDEVSLFMKNRDDDQRADDEKTLVVLSNRLAKVYNLPIWTVCAAQQAIESKMGVKNIIADDRLKLVKLLEDDKDYYDIVLARVREIKDPAAIGNYYLHYKRGFSNIQGIGEEAFRHFFPFHQPAIEVLRAITYELTTTRSAIHFMHQTLKHQIKHEGRELIRLWELFDEAVNYEEDPSGVHAGLVAIKTKRETDYRAYEACKRQIDGMTKGVLKVYRDKALKTTQTLFLYHIAHTRQQGLTPEEIANSVLIEREADSNADENNQHYETIAEALRREMRQIAQTFDEDKRPRYRFDPVFTGVDPRDEFRKARDEAEANEVMQNEAWAHLLALDEWPIKTRQMTLDLSSGVHSIFRAIAPTPNARAIDQSLEINWQGRQIFGTIGMRDLARWASENLPVPAINTEQTDLDYAVFVSSRPLSSQAIGKLLEQRKDPRVILWTPADLNAEEKNRLFDFAAYRKLVADWQGKETEDAVAVINWVANELQANLGRIYQSVTSSYARGRMDASNNRQMEFHVAGELQAILTPLADRVLTAAYESRIIKFETVYFRREEAVKVINGIVKTGSIPKNAKPNQNIDAARNFGYNLLIMKKTAERDLNTADNSFVVDLWSFIDDKLADDGQAMKIETLYKNFMGVGGPKDYGLTRRMVQIFLLCLVREGKVRIILSPKSGLNFASLDYTNIADVDFSAKVLDALVEVQKMAKPENWEVLRPYAEKLLDRPIPTTLDDAGISTNRRELNDLFADEKDQSARLVARAKNLFETLQEPNPYEQEIVQMSALFKQASEANGEISAILYALKTNLGYKAFDDSTVAQPEVDDLAVRLKNYRCVQRFVGFDSELRTAHAYCAHSLPDLVDLKGARKAQRQLADKLAKLQPYIDSDVKLKTELIGHTPPEAGENGTLGALIQEYSSVYITLHDNTLYRIDDQRAVIRRMLESDDLKALQALEKITALSPAVSSDLKNQLTDLASQLFVCASPSRASVEESLHTAPTHECALSFDMADQVLAQAQAIAVQAQTLFDQAMDRKLQVFMNPTVRTRLEQGKSETGITGILQCNDASTLRGYLVRTALADKTLADTINRYLKKIVVKRVKLSEFKPGNGTIERNQIPTIAREFQTYLEEQLSAIENGDDTLPMLQVE